jgi:hypothetical protein
LSRSLNNLLQVEKNLKKMNGELKKVKTLEKENTMLHKKLDKK